ncbi:oxidoreductase [Zopfochytrium polystomum]|nr:oxidoreductase [Zopfochytrium polystomum]
MSSNLRVLIVGASIAGPTAAYWFARAGARVTVVERFPALRTNGQGIDIRTVGVTVMRRMPGMEAAVLAKKSALEGISFLGPDGRPVATFRATGDPDQQSLVSEYEIFRGDLAGILYDLTKDDESIEYVFGEQVSAIDQRGREGPLKVEFASGRPSREYDLVVACDGSSSRTRAIGLGCDWRDYVHPMNIWAVYFTVKGDLLEGSNIGQSFSTPGGRFMALGPDPTRTKTLVCFMAIHPRSKADATLPFREALKEGNDALKQYVAEYFAGGGWKTRQILDAMMESEDFYGSEIVQVKPPKLYNGRFVLAGDAGYAPGPTGGGTSLALAGAYILAGEISKHAGDIDAGLRGYEERMRPIIAEMQKVPPFVPDVFAPQTEWGLWVRNQIFSFVTWSRLVEFGQKYFGGAFASTEDDKLKLPEYKWSRL